MNNGQRKLTLQKIVLGEETLSNTPHMLSGTVSAVDEKSRTCTVDVVDGGQSVTLSGVKLMAVVEDGLLLVPAKDSTVTLLNTPMAQPVIIQYSKLKKVVSVVDGSKYTISDGKFIFNKGSNGGLVKSKEVSDSDNKIIQDITTLKGLLSGLITAAGTSPVTPWEIGMSAAFSALSAYVSQVLAPTVKTTFENSDVQH